MADSRSSTSGLLPRDRLAFPRMDSVVVRADRAIVEGEARGATAIRIDAGVITAVGDDVDATDARIVDWSGRAVVPGTVNAHNHSFQSLLRGFGDDLPFLEWREKALYRYSPRL